MGKAQKERKTQDRVIKLFKEKLNYNYLGNWGERPDNSNVKEELLVKFLKKQGYSENLIKKALFELKKLIISLI